MTKAMIQILGGVVLLGGCDLKSQLDSFKQITFQLPERKYTVSTMDPSWHPPPLDGVPPVTCGAGGIVMDCCNPPAPLAAIDCVRSPLACVEGTCALKFTYDQVQMVDLAREVPALASSKGQVFSQMLLKTIDIAIDANTMNVTLPPVSIYLAPSTVRSATDPMARRVAMMSMKTPGFTGMESIPLDEASQQLFSMYARDFQTPFNILVSTDIVLGSGTVVPQGQLDFRVGGSVEAKF
jgi:hypothetical protein